MSRPAAASMSATAEGFRSAIPSLVVGAWSAEDELMSRTRSAYAFSITAVAHEFALSASASGSCRRLDRSDQVKPMLETVASGENLGHHPFISIPIVRK